jgi:chromosomal replication initiation ATPase DnaA
MTPSQITRLLTDFYDFQESKARSIFKLRRPKIETIKKFAQSWADEPELKSQYSNADYLNEIIAITGANPERLQTDFKTRKQEYVLARQLHCYVAYKTSKNSLKTIGEMYGKSHCNILHGNKKIDNWRRFDAGFRKQTKRLFEMLEKTAV